MSGPFKRRSSIKTLPAMSLPVDSIRRASIRRSSVALGQQGSKTAGQQEVPWDILDRCLLPIIFCHATAVLVSNTLNVLKIWEVTTFTLFIWFTIVTIGAVLFYHNLKVLLNRLSEEQDQQRHIVIPLEKKLLFTVWTLSKPESFLAAGDRFGIAKSSAHKVFMEMIEQLCRLLPEYILWPNIQNHLQTAAVTAAGKAVLITGCDSRVGSALARQLDEQGFTVFAGFQNASSSSVAEELKEVCSGRLHVLQLDVASETQILAASLYAVEHLPDGAPGLWAVVHAQSWVALGEIEWIPPQVIRKATDINFIGPTRVTQIMLPLVRRAKGRIVVVTSGLCRVSSPVRGIHCGLLAALESQAECLRKELKSRGVDVVVVAPGELTSGSSWLSDQHIIDQAKDMWKQLGQEQKSEYGEHYFETALRSLEKHTKAQEVDLFPVLRALNDAIIRTFPLTKYTPVSRKEKIQVFIAEYLPRYSYAENTSLVVPMNQEEVQNKFIPPLYPQTGIDNLYSVVYLE